MRHTRTTGRRFWHSALSATSVFVTILAGPCGAWAAASAEPYRYLAIIGGDCERLVLDGRDATPGCSSKLVNVDFGDGRVAFSFTSPSAHGAVVTTFLGRSSVQKGLGSYRLEVDEVSTVTTAADRGPIDVRETAAGHCAMTGDPTREPARFECAAERRSGRSAATFVSAGVPTVYAGDRSGTDDDPTISRTTPTF